MRNLVLTCALALLFLMPGTAAIAQGQSRHYPSHSSHSVVKTFLYPATHFSHIRGPVFLRQLEDGGTFIKVIAFGLQPGHQYKSLYYDNSTCQLEPYSAEDVIGGKAYTANAHGVGTTQGNADDDLDEIHSVSVRDAASFKLLACARVNSSSYPSH